MSARRNGDYARAVSSFESALRRDPSAELVREVQFRLAESYYLAGDSERAISGFSAYIQAFPNRAETYSAHYFLAGLYRARRDYPNAIAQLRIVRAQTQTLAGEIDAEIAQVMVLAGDFANANAQFDRALADSTLSPASRVRISLRAGAALIASNNPARAAARYDAALPFVRDASTRASLNLFAGQQYAAANQMDLATERWKWAINETPEESSAYTALLELVNRNIPVDEFQRGLVDYYAGAYDPAIAAFQRYLSSSSTHVADARYYIAKSLARKGNPAQALVEYDVIINTLRAGNRLGDAMIGKGEALEALGKMDDAIGVYKQLSSLAPNDAQADGALALAGDMLTRFGRYREAAVIYDQLAASYPAATPRRKHCSVRA
jgi:soluble lytic murein transglycosylase